MNNCIAQSLFGKLITFGLVVSLVFSQLLVPLSVYGQGTADDAFANPPALQPSGTADDAFANPPVNTEYSYPDYVISSFEGTTYIDATDTSGGFVLVDPSGNTNNNANNTTFVANPVTTPTPRPGGGGQQGSGLLGGLAGGAAGIGTCISGGLAGVNPKSAKSVPIANTTIEKNTGGEVTKDCLLDGMAFQLREALVKGIIKAVVNFINEGFQGGPGYMQDEDSLFRDLQDEQFNTFINNSQNFSSLCSAWAPDVRLALAVNYSTSVGGQRVTQISGTGTGTPQPLSSGEPERCQLSSDGYDEEGNPQANQDFWGDFLTRTTTTGGNPLTSFLSVQDRLAQQAQYEAQKKRDEIQRGQGFFDSVDCSQGASQYSSSPGSFTIGGVNCAIKTPARSVGEQTNNTLMSDLRRLELSDEFDEIFSQLVAMLIQMILGQLGLSGVSERSGGSASFIDQYANEDTPQAVVVQNRQDLLDLLAVYRENAVQYLDYKRDSLNSLLEVRERILDVYTCYVAKYDTWVYRGNGLLIPQAEVASVPESERIRATYFTQTQVGILGGDQVLTTIYLTPEQSQRKIQQYERLLGEIEGYISQINIEIGQVELDIARVVGYEVEVGSVTTDQAWLENTISSSTILAQIEQEFIDNPNTVLVSDNTPVPSNDTGADYNGEDLGEIMQSVDGIIVRLQDVGLNTITLTVDTAGYDFGGQSSVNLKLAWVASDAGGASLQRRSFSVAAGEVETVVINQLRRETSYDIDVSVDDNTIDLIRENSFSVGTDTTTVRAVPQNLTVEQILQVYLVALEELTIHDAAAAFEQFQQIEDANEVLLQGENGSGGIVADLESCRSFTRVVQPGDSEDGSGTVSDDGGR